MASIRNGWVFVAGTTRTATTTSPPSTTTGQNKSKTLSLNHDFLDILFAYLRLEKISLFEKMLDGAMDLGMWQ